MILIILVLLGCSKRKRDNPLDPLNPKTQGKPSFSKVLSDKRDITLEWTRFPDQDLTGYNVYRQTEDEAAPQRIAHVGSTISTYTDSGLTYDVAYAYQLSALSEDYESPLSDVVEITPGPFNYWAIDGYSGSVLRLSYDGAHIMMQTQLAPYPTDIAADSTTKTAWVVDVIGYLWKFSQEGEILLWTEGLFDPTHVVFDPVWGDIWVADVSGQNLVRYDTMGIELNRIDGFTEITSLDLVGSQGGCWVADGPGGIVHRYSREGVQQIAIENNFKYPQAISASYNDEWAWVSDSLQLHRIWHDGKIDSVAESPYAFYDLSTDQETGDCWVLVIENADGSDRAVKYSYDGAILVDVGGFKLTRDIEANPRNGGCLIADSGNYRVVRLSAAGEILSEFTNLGTPWALSVE